MIANESVGMGRFVGCGVMRVLVVVVALWALCVASAPTQAQDDAVIEGLAFVEEVDFERIRGRVQLTIRGYLADPCTSVGDIIQSVTGDVITISVTTQRPADVFCATVLEPLATTYWLNTVGLRGGDYTLIVNDYATIITLTSADIAGADDIAPACYLVDEDTQTVINLDVGVCFLAPSDADVSIPYPNTVMVSRDVGGERVHLLMRSAPTSATTLSEVASLQIAAYGDVTLDFQRVAIGSLNALVSDNMPVPNGGRRAYILVDDQMLRLTLASSVHEDAELEDAMLGLWSLFVASVSYINVDDIQGVSLASLGMRFAVPMGWQVESGAGSFILTDGEDNPIVGIVRFNLVGDATPLETIATTYGISLSDAPPQESIGAGAGVVAYVLDVEETCRTFVMLRDEGIAHVMLLSPTVCDLDGNISKAGIRMLLDTLVYDAP